MIIPQSWQDALRKIQEGGFPEAVIAGGCLRDLDHGLSEEHVKDVDIFVRYMGAIDLGVTNELGERGSLTQDLLAAALGEPAHTFDPTDEGAKEYFDWNRISFVANYNLDPRPFNTDDLVIRPCGPHIDVIAMDLPIAPPLTWGDVVTNDFDIGLNRIYYDGKDVVRTAAYGIDKVGKTMTVLRCRNDFELARIKARIARLTKFKYREYQPRNVGVKS